MSVYLNVLGNPVVLTAVVAPAEPVRAHLHVTMASVSAAVRPTVLTKYVVQMVVAGVVVSVLAKSSAIMACARRPASQPVSTRNAVTMVVVVRVAPVPRVKPVTTVNVLGHCRVRH